MNTDGFAKYRIFFSLSCIVLSAIITSSCATSGNSQASAAFINGIMAGAGAGAAFVPSNRPRVAPRPAPSNRNWNYNPPVIFRGGSNSNCQPPAGGGPYTCAIR